ncbi:MAG TPA: YbhB/YbcL family Raf kinase inhibitor-like protein [Capsulimonadaceae bacterium]|nr:YbhB/YbcL family Raf kinase inhibitor-like protein [Capsulimonadaceae bacterium]
MRMRFPWENGFALASGCLFFVALGVCGCAHSLGPAGPDTLTVSSTAFKEGQNMPAQNTCGGTGISPPLAWSKPPDHTASLAITCLDPDAPSGTFTHWLVYDIPASAMSMVEGSAPAGSLQGMNDFGSTGYGAPCPPPGNPHHYLFTVYALDNKPDLKGGASRTDLFAAIKGHVLAKGEITGLYGR